MGILSTPVIDRVRNMIYIVDETLTGGGPPFFLHAVDLTTGAEKLNGPAQIQATVPGTGWLGGNDGVNGELLLLAADHTDCCLPTVRYMPGSVVDRKGITRYAGQGADALLEAKGLLRDLLKD